MPNMLENREPHQGREPFPGCGEMLRATLLLLAVAAWVATATTLAPALLPGDDIDLDAPVLDDDLIAQVNADPTSTWTAGRNPVFEGKTWRDVYGMFGEYTTLEELLQSVQKLPQMPVESEDQLPEEYDGRVEWGECRHKIRDQGHCGSCWAFAAAEVMTDRTCIQGGIDKKLSAQELVSCSNWNFGCHGGLGSTAFHFIEKYGIRSEACYPYISGYDGRSRSCEKECRSQRDETRYYAKNERHVKTVEAMQKELMSGGPLWAGFLCYSDLAAYRKGVYHHKGGSLRGAHAVVIVGWGVEEGTPYWVVANSWSTRWGDKGYFKMIRGTNDCYFESVVCTVDFKEAK